MQKTILILLAIVALNGCDGDRRQENLGDIDITGGKQTVDKVFIKPKSDAEIRSAYTDYLNSADIDDQTRSKALARLAELELANSNKIKTDNSSGDAVQDDEDIDLALDRTINLLNTSLHEYPTAKNNDTLLYQLAKAYDQKGEHTLSMEQLKNLVEQFPESQFYTESQFRIAEEEFTLQHYKDAEFAYTEVIVSPENEIFLEKALHKRGWSKFKQQYYTDAVDDFLQAIDIHHFDAYEKLNNSELEQFNEYFRAIGLAFTYLGGTEALSDYFKNNPDFPYIYYTYSVVGDIFLKEERYTDAATTYQEFIKNYPSSDDIPYAHLKTIEAWQKSGFDKMVYDAIERFYVAYNPTSKYWTNQNDDSNVNRVIRRSLKKYVVLMTGYYHNKYQNSHNQNDYVSAEKWYKRYLEHYSAYAQSDNIYFLYGELLSQNKQLISALDYYEKAAYQNDLIINKDAAYASITTSDMLFERHPDDHTYLQKHIKYALKFGQTYPGDKITNKIIVHAAELSFKDNDYKTAIKLSDIYLHANTNEEQTYISSLKAESYFNLAEYAEAESLYAGLLSGMLSEPRDRQKYTDKLALAIYKQGELARNNNDDAKAIADFSRISQITPASNIAATGLYDAIALDMQHKQWEDAITLIQRFQSLYPTSEHQVDVAKKLSAAYLYSNQGIKAAKEFEKLSGIGSDVAVKSAALWQAAELYEKKGELKDAIRIYEEYANKFSTPFPQYMEAMNKLTELYALTSSPGDVSRWRTNITKADKRALNNALTDRTKFIASLAYLGLADEEKSSFDKVKLTLPLNKSLKQKKTAMQNAVKLYGEASQYKVFDVITESTHEIATIYKDFSKALMDSDRPTTLGEEELNQYEILLEDQAFPFEDKAIQFYEINLSRIKDGYFNKWISNSHDELISLFPTRYKREPKEDDYIEYVD